MEGNKPEKKFKASPITATIWMNTTIKDSKELKLYSVNVERTYKDKEEFKTTSSLRPNDIPKAVLVLQKAYEYLSLKGAKDEE